MDVQGLYEIYDFWHEPFWQTIWFKALMISAFTGLLFAILFFAWLLLRLRKKSKSLWEVALARVAVIRERDLDNPEVRRAVYVELTSLLKEYCVNRYGWQVGGLTDRECIIFLHDKHVDLRMQEAFERIACGGESIKFAHESVNRDRVLADCALCKDFFCATIPLEQR